MHFQPGGGPEYCRACRDDDLPCGGGESGPDGQLCPYREHALISLQEHEAWDVLLACQGQLRLAPSGHVIGIDMPAALKIGAVREFDLAVLLELLRLPRRVWSRRCVAIEFRAAVAVHDPPFGNAVTANGLMAYDSSLW